MSYSINIISMIQNKWRPGRQNFLVVLQDSRKKVQWLFSNVEFNQTVCLKNLSLIYDYIKKCIIELSF